MNENESHIIKDNIKNLRNLNEHVNRFDIVDAIKNREVIKIYYQGDNTVNRGYRTIEPHVLGRTKKMAKDPEKSEGGNMVVRAWQQAGATDTPHRKWNPSRGKDGGGWRLFRLDGISQLLPTGMEFPKKGNGIRPDYRQSGDEQIDVLIQVDYNDGVGYSVSGGDSLDEPETFVKRVGDFDPESIKSKEYADDEKNADNILKQKVNTLYDMVKNSYKKSVNDYIVVNKNNKILAVPIYNRTKYSSDEIIGKLPDLVRMLNSGEVDANKPLPKVLPSMERDRREFGKNVEKRLANKVEGDKNIVNI